MRAEVKITCYFGKGKKMKIVESGKAYDLQQLGGGLERLEIASKATIQGLLSVLIDRTCYLYNVFHYTETKDAFYFLFEALKEFERETTKENIGHFNILDEGHIYEIVTGRTSQTLTFVKHGDAITYEKERPGILSQEVMRAVIEYLTVKNYSVGPTKSVRMALFLYEVRAWRRKMEKVNRQAPLHDDQEHPRASRDHPFSDVPFGPEGFELLPVGEDGHVIPQ